jgi:hypothetical protein
MAERWADSARLELLNHVIVINEQHPRCLPHDYVASYNAEHVHTQPMDSPAGRPTENRPSPHAQVVGFPVRVIFTTATSGGTRRSGWAPSTRNARTVAADRFDIGKWLFLKDRST